MLLSMTGFGEARHQDDQLSILAELRTVNNRHFKLSSRISDPYGALEGEVDRLVRQSVRRGTVQLTLRVDRPRRAEDYRLNLVALNSYRDQLQTLRGPDAPPVDLATLLTLPGIVEERRHSEADPQEDWPRLLAVLTEALNALQRSRAEEGKAMAAELRSLGETLAAHLAKVEEHGPVLLAAYHQRLLERVQNLVQDRVAVEPKDLIREVAIFAERADVAEEITRLKAHIVQYLAVLEEPESAGRKLEFLVQEMGRETNTIGSKANDLEITRQVVAMKGTLEKIRELIQNIE